MKSALAAGTYFGDISAGMPSFGGPPEKISEGSTSIRRKSVCGQAFFITDDTPALNFLEFMEPIVEGVGLSLPPRNRRVPYPVMWIAAVASELWALVGKPFGVPPPVLTRSSVRFICRTHTFDGSKARRCLGYAPKYGWDESLERTIAWWREHAGLQRKDAA